MVTQKCLRKQWWLPHSLIDRENSQVLCNSHIGSKTLQFAKTSNAKICFATNVIIITLFIVLQVFFKTFK